MTVPVYEVVSRETSIPTPNRPSYRKPQTMSKTNESATDWNILKAFVRGTATPNDAKLILSDPVNWARKIRAFVAHLDAKLEQYGDEDTPEEKRWQRNTTALRDALKRKGLAAVAAAEHAMLIDAIERWWNGAGDEDANDAKLEQARFGAWAFSKSGRWSAPAHLWRGDPPFDFDVERLYDLHNALDEWQTTRDDTDDVDVLEENDRGLYEAAMQHKQKALAA